MAPGNALLGPDTVTWRVNREPVVFLGGGRALLLQVAHPLVAAAVAQHSDYEAHPWQRLTRTLETTIQIVFGPPAVAARATARLRGRHATVRGTSAEGARYDARDPELLLWVWATLVDTALTLYERCLAPLGAAERERFYGEQQLFAHACGIPAATCPPAYADFRAYWDRVVDGDLRVTAPALRVRASIEGGVLPTPLRPLLAPHTLVTAGLLPPGLRAQYGLAWSTAHEARLNALLTAVRAGVRVVPRRARVLPVELVAARGVPRRRGARRGPARLRPKRRRAG